jgi:hypothetical protein
VKDSFADLYLERHGFEVLFEVRWVYPPPADPTATASAGWGVSESVWSLAARATSPSQLLHSPLSPGSALRLLELDRSAQATFTAMTPLLAGF